MFVGIDPVEKTPWPMEWVSIKLLKSDLKRQARDMELALVAALRPAVAPSGAGSKRWSGLIWDGADEGRPRRSGRHSDGSASTAAEALLHFGKCTANVVRQPHSQLCMHNA